MIEAVAPGVRRLLAPNPGLMSGPGTNTYLLGEHAVVVVDPGPLHEGHLAAILAEAGGPIVGVWLTHAHPDHAKAVGRLLERTGARLYAWARPNPTYAIPDLPAPDVALADGQVLTVEGEAYAVLHTPGHASDHVCFFRARDGLLFTGDVVLGRGTVVIAPPDGDMGVYLATLDRLARLGARRLAPGHGEVIDEAQAKLESYIHHRLAREAQVLALVQAGTGAVDAIVAALYAEVDPRLHPIAAEQVLAHLLKLESEGRVVRQAGGWGVP